MKIDALTAIDFYKTGHGPQYPLFTTEVYSNFTPRSNKWADAIFLRTNNKVVNYGLQFYLKDFLIDCWNESFFNKPKDQVLRRYKRRLDNALGKDAVSVDHIGELHDLGYLPIRIKSLPEGARVPTGVPLSTIVNTHEDFAWLTNYLETSFSTYSWKLITTATTAFEYKQILTKWAKKTGTPLEFVQWQAHDFSMRGQSGLYDAKSSCSGHLTSFTGTDVINTIDFIEEFYNGNSDKEMIGGSVNATEHSVMCMGTMDAEIETFKRLITELYPSGIISIVSDTWDYWQVVTEYTLELKDIIMNRDGKVVLRPDSGDPVLIVCGEDYNTYDDLEEAKCCEEDIMNDLAHDHCEVAGEMGCSEYDTIARVGDKFYKITATFEYNRHDKQYYYVDNYDSFEKRVSAEEYEPTPEFKGSVQCLWDIFGGSITETGHKMLDSHIGLIYGDSITLERATQILEKLDKKGFASGNIVFGVGSYTYQHVTRDTHGFAMKATSGVVDGQRRDIFKDPKTDDGLKKSAKGLLRVELEDGNYVLYDQQTESQEQQGELKTVFLNGNLTVNYNFEEIRARLNKELDNT